MQDVNVPNIYNKYMPIPSWESNVLLATLSVKKDLSGSRGTLKSQRTLLTNHLFQLPPWKIKTVSITSVRFFPKKNTNVVKKGPFDLLRLLSFALQGDISRQRCFQEIFPQVPICRWPWKTIIFQKKLIWRKLHMNHFLLIDRIYSRCTAGTVIPDWVRTLTVLMRPSLP